MADGYKHPDEDELEEISFNEEVKRQARRLHTAGNATSLAAAIAVIRPQMEKERARVRQEEAAEETSLADQFAPGREGRRRRGVAIV